MSRIFGIEVPTVSAVTAAVAAAVPAAVAAHRRSYRLPVSIETLILAVICLLDLVSTVYWVRHIDAEEGNPLMAFYLHHGGVAAFAIAKAILCFGPLAVAEWARRHHPRFVHAALRCGIAGYVGLYGLGVFHINKGDTPLTDPLEFPAAAAVTTTTARH